MAAWIDTSLNMNCMFQIFIWSVIQIYAPEDKNND